MDGFNPLTRISQFSYTGLTLVISQSGSRTKGRPEINESYLFFKGFKYFGSQKHNAPFLRSFANDLCVSILLL